MLVPPKTICLRRLCDLHPVGPSRIRPGKGCASVGLGRPYLACIPLVVIPHLSHFVSLVCLKWGAYCQLMGDKEFSFQIKLKGLSEEKPKRNRGYRMHEIGRASCREREWAWGAAWGG